MSRRSTASLPSRLPARSVGRALILLVTLTLGLPSLVVAQDRSDAGNLLWKWQLLEYRGADGTSQLVPPGIGITALPFAGTVKGDAACSSYEASYSLVRESFRVDTPVIQGRGCDAAAQAIDDAFYQGLADTRTWSTSGSILTLMDEVGDVVMTLTRAELPPDPTLARWELARIGAADGAIQPVIAGVQPWVEFLRGGRIVGSTGCGSFLGSYTTNDSTMSISDVDSRLTDCTSALQEQASLILDTFAQITDFDVLPAGLVLEDGAGTTRMALVPDIDLGRRTWTPIEVLDGDGKPVSAISARLNTSAVRFAGTTADGRSFCRGFDGGSLRSGLALSVSRLVPDPDSACPKPNREEAVSSQDVEDAFLGALESAASHALRGDELELMDVEGRPIVRLVPQSELVGPTWVLGRMDVTPKARKQRLRAPLGEEPLTAIFEDVETIGVIQGSTGVNDYIANYAIPGAAQIRITEASPFGRACGGRKAGQPACVQETAFLSLLQSADSFIVRPEDLRLFRGTRLVLSFIPEQALPIEG
ncbi:MAG TPA: META domain-containing protein [Candidatus Limnocylindrales bacterium]|nr:META domain-containing protein [Candidatus Limnocylindrales bacterium]